MSTSSEAPIGGLFGRDEEMASLLDSWSAVCTGSSSVVLVGGDAGIGKTRLLTELANRSNGKLLWGACLPLGERGVPYLPLIEMIRSLDDQESHSLPPVLKALLSSDGDIESRRAISRNHLFQSVIEFLDDLASATPLLVVVEDLHWADRSTRDLLDFLIGLLRDRRILFVTSFRTDDLSPEHPLRSILAEWLRRPSVRRLDLGPLSTADSLRLVASLHRGEITREQASRLVERANGNPYFLEELIAAGLAVPGAPGEMRDFLLRRTRQLSPELLRLLRIASAGGASIDDELLARVAGRELEETRELLREGVETQLLVIDHRSCRFRHALLAEALYEDLLPGERRDYHAAFADALVSGPGLVAPGELATHQAEAGRIDEALTAWVEAGRLAESQFAFAEASLGYQSALDLWELADNPESVAGITRLELLHRLAEAAFLAGRADFACDVAHRELEEIDEHEYPIAAGLVYHHLARYLGPTARSDEAMAVQERAVELIPSSPASRERAEVLAGLATLLQSRNQYHESRDVSQEAIGIATATGAIHAEIRAKNTLGNAVCTIESVDRGLAIISEALDQAREAGEAHEQARSLWNLQANRFLGSRLSEYVDNSEAIISSLRIVQPHWVVDQMVHTADCLQMLGRWNEADALIEDACREDPMQVDRIGVPELLIGRGRLHEAKAVAEARNTPVLGTDVTSRLWNLVNLAQIEVADGNHAEAISLIDRVLADYARPDKPTVLSHGITIGMRAAADLAQAARFRSEASTLDQVIEAGGTFHQRLMDVMAQPGPADGWKREVGALAAQCDAEMSRLHGRPDTDAWLRANDAWLELEMPYRGAYCRFRWAEDALASGIDREEVGVVLRESSESLDRMGEKLLLGQVKALARRARLETGDRSTLNRYGLTEREREVLAQVSRGATNRQIAQALYISEKTASVHVSNILRKLMVSNRGEAAAKALHDGLVDLSELSAGS